MLSLSLVESAWKDENYVINLSLMINDNGNMLIVVRWCCGTYNLSVVNLVCDTLWCSVIDYSMCCMVPLTCDTVPYSVYDTELLWYHSLTRCVIMCRCDSVIWVDTTDSCAVRPLHAHSLLAFIKRVIYFLSEDSYSVQNCFRNDHQKFTTQVCYLLNEWNAIYFIV